MARPGTIDRRAAFLTTRFGRRLFASLVAVALVPIALLAVVSYRTVTQELRDQADARLHRAARATGLLLAGRLFRLAEQGPAGVGTQATPRRPGSTGATLRIERGEDASALALVLVHEGPAGELVRSEIPRDVVFADVPALVVPDGGEYLVLARDGILASSFQGPLEVPPSWQATPPPRDVVEWTHADVAYLGRVRELFLGAALDAPSWNIVVLEPRDAVFGATAAFRTAFLLVVALILLGVPLLTLGQIRRRLVPLERLREGARRIGARDLDARVEVMGDDELAEVAGSFNAMAEGLAAHFRALDTLLDIDREILTAGESEDLAGILARRAFSLCACDAAAVVLGPGDETDTGATFLASGPEAEIRRSRAPDAADLASWRNLTWRDEPLVEARGALAPLARLDLDHARVFPLEAGARPLGALVVARRGAAFPREEATAYLRQLADQAAMALSHLRERERSRALAYYDRLTGLPNRFMLQERIRQALRQDLAPGRCHAVCVVAVDGIARILETLGQTSADEMVVQVARRLLDTELSSDVFRIERDEFAVLLTDLESADGAARVAARLTEAVSRPLEGPRQEIVLATAAGVAVHPQDGDTPDLLERNARTALRAARAAGGDRYRFYSSSMQSLARERLSLESDLRRALREGELRVVFQPIVEVESRALLGAEALVRWMREGVPVSPGVFVPLAEEAGLVDELGACVLRSACGQFAELLRELPGLGVHVNVSPLQLRGDELPGLVRTVLRETGLPARALTLEITESTLTDHGDATRERLGHIGELGVGLAIDDFGTGYSSLEQLRHLPADLLKIDRCFVEHLPDNAGDAAMVRAVIDLAHGRGLRVVAEGVETEAQLAFLRSCGCDEAQGFLFAPGLDPDDFAKLAREAALRGELG